MAKDTCYKQLCKCSNPECNHEEGIYVWTSEVESFSRACVKCEDGFLLPHQPEAVSAPALIGLHKERNLSERRVRNHKHFRNEVLPTITDRTAKQHFSKKLNIKL